MTENIQTPYDNALALARLYKNPNADSIAVIQSAYRKGYAKGYAVAQAENTRIRKEF